MPAQPETSLSVLANAVARGERSAASTARSFLANAALFEPQVGAFLHLDEAWVLGQAEDIDRRRAAGQELGPLAGVPIAVKDSLCTKDAPTTCASRILVGAHGGWRSPYDATVVDRLRRAGAIIFGKTNLDEFAMGSSTENSARQVTRNPWATDRVPGGSSGGSASAVAARMAPAALGSDTGGSIRQPASFTHTVGLKPTYGRVSRFGLVAFASSLDQVGPIAADVRSAARLFEVIAGTDPRDATTTDHAVGGIEAACGDDIRGLRIGVPSEYFAEGLDPEVERRVREALDALASRGCRIVSVSLPHTQYAIATYYVIATAEASSNLARFDGVRFGRRVETSDGALESMYEATRGNGFGREVQRRIMLGTYVLSAGYYDAYYLKAQRARTLVRKDFTEAFGQVDVLATPTSPTTAWRLGEKLDDPLAMYLADVYTLPASLAGLPALSVPCGLSDESLPIGLQLIAPPFEEARLCAVAAAWEADNPGAKRAPTL